MVEAMRQDRLRAVDLFSVPTSPWLFSPLRPQARRRRTYGSSLKF